MANGATLDAFMLDGTQLFRRTLGVQENRIWGPTLTSTGRMFTWVRGQLAEHDPNLDPILWSNQSPWSSGSNDINRLVATAGDRAVVSGSAGGGIGYVKCFDLVANQLLWQAEERTFGTPAIAGNEVFVIQERGVKSLSLADGRLIRDYPTGGESLVRAETQPIVLRDAVIVSSETSTYIFSRESGEILQTIPHGGPVAFSDKHLLIASKGTVHSYYANRAPTATEIPPAQSIEDSTDLRVSLYDYFDDEEDGAEGLAYSIVAGNPDPAGILTNLRIEDGVLRFDLVPDTFGPSGLTIRATDRAGQSVELVYSINVLELVEFSSIPGLVYAVDYSEDMKSWHRVFPTLTAIANRTQWIDNGPPKTASLPASVSKRYYRIVTLSAP